MNEGSLHPRCCGTARGIIRYLRSRSPAGAIAVSKRVKAAVRTLSFHPFIGTPMSDPQIRRLTISPYPYLIFYSVVDEEIAILAIRQGARVPKSMPGSK